MIRCVLAPVSLLLLVASGPATTNAAPRGAQSRTWRWEITVAPDLAHADVRLCMLGFGARLLRDHDGALSCTRVLPHPNGQPSFRANPARDGIIPLGLGSRGCLRYRVDFGTLVQNNERARRVGRDISLVPGHLLLRPAVWPRTTRAEVVFRLPEGLDLALPWARASTNSNSDGSSVHRYVVTEFMTRTYAPMAIGRFETLRFQAAEASFDVALLDRPVKASRAGIQVWLERAARAQATLFGRFPVDHAALIVQPSPGHGEAVLFGRAFTGGGSAVRLLLAQQATDDELPGEWVGVHEMVHLGVPRLDEAGQWLNEGFVTYYQEILRARSGLRSETACWEALADGFRRGRRSGGERSLREEARLMHQYRSYWRVYWGGAALALRIDHALRKETAGRLSLDDVMRTLWRRHRFPARPWDGEALLAQADRDLGTTICAREARAHVHAKDFPPVEALLTELGVVVTGRRVRFDDTAPGAALRKAMTARR